MEMHRKRYDFWGFISSIIGFQKELSKLFLFILIFGQGSLWCSPWVIVANGTQLPVDKLKESLVDRKVLMLDGAVNRFKSLGVYPDCILGDFDSIKDLNYWGILGSFSEIEERSPSYKGNFGITIIPAKDQNYTDLEKGIIYCDGVGATSILIVQATGGRMDHTLGNLGLLKKYYRSDRELIIQTEEEKIFCLCNDTIVIEGGVGGYCAILGYPQAIMTTSGLAYNGSEYSLQQGIQDSICNTIIDSQVSIAIQGEALIILPKSCRLKVKSED